MNLLHNDRLDTSVATPQPGPKARQPIPCRSAAAWLTGLAAALLLAGAPSSPAQTYLIDLGGSYRTSRGPIPNDPQNSWNNLDDSIGQTSTGVLSNLVSSINTTSTVNLMMVSRFTGVNANGTQGSSLYPANATRDSLFGNTGNHSGLSNIFPRFKLTGLDPATVYSFTFYASRTGVSDNREAGYTVTGGNSGFAALDAANNIDQTATVANITPDAAGEISIAIDPTANNNNSVKYTYLGVLRMDALPPQTPLAFTQEPVSQKAVQLKPATFTCAVSGPPPYLIQWYENGAPIPTANEFSYTIPSAELYMDGWTYSVTVSNQLYGVVSSNAVLTVLSDTNPPALVKAISYDGITVQLTFNEPLDWTINDPQYYQVNAGAVQVLGTSPNLDNTAVTLTLSSLITGTFTVVVNNLQDVAGNPIAANTTLTGEVVPFEDQELLFDFGASSQTTQFGPPPDDPEHYWNNVTSAGSSDTGEMLNLVSAHNAVTPIGLSMIRRFNGPNENGTLAAAVFPQKATRDSLYGNTETWSELANVFPSFKLTGLNPERKYTLTFYASRAGVSDNRETGYTIEGAGTNYTVLDAANNINNTAGVEGISPNAAGEIIISLAPTPNNNNTYHFTYLGVLRLSPYVAPLQFQSPVIENGKIKVRWTGTGQLQRAPTVNGQWVDIEPVPTSPYEEDFVPGENRFYRLQQ